MTQLEGQLRTAFQEKAGRISADAPPLRLDAVADSISSRRVHAGPKTRPKWLAPVAASVAVLAVAVAAIAASGLLGSGKTSVSATALRGVPAYYVALINRTAELRVTGTGAVLATISLPHSYVDWGYGDLAAAADDRTFALAAKTAIDYGTNQKAWPTYRLFLLRIDPGARSPSERARLTALAPPLPDHFSVDAMALSPDGRSLATITGNPIGQEQYLTVYNLKKGTSRRWNLDEMEGPSSAAGTLSWTSNGRVGIDDPNSSDAYQLVNPMARGASLAADSRVIRLHGVPRGGTTLLGLVSPDGRSVLLGFELVTRGKLYRGTFRFPGGHVVHKLAYRTVLREELLKFSVRTGQVTAVLVNMRLPGYDWEQVLWMNDSGRKLVIAHLRRGTSAGIVVGKKYTAIPWSRGIQVAAW